MKVTFNLHVLYLAAAIMLSLGTLASANDDWPQWRGPQRNDQSTETGLLKTWPEAGPKQRWVNNDAGLGYAGFSVAEGKLFTLGLDGNDEFALCLDADSGKEIWRTVIGKKYRNGWGDGPRSTPSVDGDKVYCMSAQGNLACLDVKSGKQVWGIKMSDFGGSVPKWGYAESPLVDGDLVVCTPGGDECTMLAVDKATGKVAWKSEAFNMTLDNGDVITANAHYSSILPVDHGGKRQYVQLTVLAVVGVDASNGKTLWQIPFPGRVAVIPSPIFDDGNVYVSAGYGVGSKLIELSESNKAVEKWYTKAMQNHHGSVIKVGDYFYGSSAKTFTCQSAKDGSAVWNERKIKKGALSYADGLFYHVQETDGKVLLIDASPDGVSIKGSFVLSPQTKQRNPRGKIWVHPVIANGKLYLRDQEFIHCYDIKAGKE